MLRRIFWGLISLLIAGFINKASCDTGLCKRIRIRGAIHQTLTEGFYVLKTGRTCEGHAVWEHEGNSDFLYAITVEDQKFWVGGTTLCVDDVGIHGAIDEPFDSPLQVPSGGWQEYSTVDGWVESPLSTSCEENDEPEPPDTEVCEIIQISGTKYQKSAEGIYKLKTTSGCRNKPLWEHEDHKRFIYAMIVGVDTHWVVGDTKCGTRHDDVRLEPEKLLSYSSPVDVPHRGWTEVSSSEKWVDSPAEVACKKGSDDSSKFPKALVLGIVAPLLIVLICACCVMRKCSNLNSRSASAPTTTAPDTTVTNMHVYHVDIVEVTGCGQTNQRDCDHS